MNYQNDICEKIAGEPNAPVGIRKKYERIGHGIMKKIRVLLLLLIVLLIPCIAFIACGDEEEVICAGGEDAEHVWRFDSRPHKQKLIQAGSCTTPEIRERECKGCGYKETYESAPPKGHRYDSTKKIYVNDATCESDGHYVTHCYFYEKCGHEADRIETAYGTKLEHSFLHAEPSEDDPSVGISKCANCGVERKILLGVDLDMEGDRTHIAYDTVFIKAGAEIPAKDYTDFKTVGEGEGANTYLNIVRPEPGTYLGGTEFGVTIKPNADAIEGSTYIIEALLLVKEGDVSDIKIIGKKANLGQTVEFITYNAANKTIDGLAGTVYGLTAQDYVDGVKISLLVNDASMWYQIYVNDTLVSRTINYVNDYYAGLKLGTVDIVAVGSAATEFGIDDIRIYAADKPRGYGGAEKEFYTTVSLSTGEQVSLKKPVDKCVHNYVPGAPVAPGCETAGYTISTCSLCSGQILSGETAPTEHNYGKATIYAPTCFDAGYSVSECENCGQKSGFQYAPKLAHIHGADATVVIATCDEHATVSGNCTGCDTEFVIELSKEKIASLTTDEASKEIYIAIFEAVKAKYYADENYEDGDYSYMLAHGHKLGDNVTVINPTCTTDGYTIGACVYCGIEYKDGSTVVTAFGHYALEYEIHAATCTTEGYKAFTCRSCNEDITQKTEDALGHKIFSNTRTEKGRTYVTNLCVNCEYSYEYEVVKTFPTYSEVSKKLGSALKYSFYEDDKESSTQLVANGGDYMVNDGNAYKNGQWLNDTNKKYGVFIAGPTGSDTYVNFPNKNLGITDNTVWEFDVKFPNDGMGDDRTPQYADGAMGFSLSYDSGNVGGALLKLYNNGAIVANNWKDGSSGFGTKNMSENKTTWDVECAPAGTVNRDTWTRIAIALDMINKQYSVYVNGSLKTTIDLPENFGPKLRYMRFRGIHTGVVSATMYRNMYYHKGDFPAYMTAPEEPKDVFKTNFIADNDINVFDSNGYVTELKGKFSVDLKQNFKPTISGGKLNIQAGPGIVSAASAKAGTDSHINAIIPQYNGISYTVKTNVKFNKTTGFYDIIRLKRDGQNATLPLIYIEEGKLKAFGSEWTYTVTENEEMEILAIIRDGAMGDTYDLYINGVRRVANVSFDETDLGKATTGNALQMFYVRSIENDMDISVSDIDVYKADVSEDVKFNVTEGASTEESSFGDDFSEKVSYVVALGNGLSIEDKRNFRASVSGSSLNLNYDKQNVKTHFGADDEGFDSAISLPLTNYKNKIYVISLKFTPKFIPVATLDSAQTDGYDVIAVDRKSAKQSIVYVENGMLKAFGTEFKQELEKDKAITVEVVVKDDRLGDKYTLYVDGKCVATDVSFDDTDVGKISGDDSILRMFRVTNENGVMNVDFDALNIYTLNSATEDFGTAFTTLEGANAFFEGTKYVQDLYGDLEIATKKNFLATISDGNLYLVYDKTRNSVNGADLTGFDSHIFATIPTDRIEGNYTVSFTVTFNKIVGKYDLFKLYNADKELAILTADANKLYIFGTNWTKELADNETVKLDVIVKGKTVTVYVGGILVANNVSVGDDTYTAFKMFNVLDEELVMDVIVSAINVYDKEVIPSNYTGKLENAVLGGRADCAVKFDAESDYLNFVPANTMLPGGYYYEEISGSYLLYVAPITTKILGNTEIVKVGTSNGTVGAEDGVWTLHVGNFKTNGVNNLNLDFDGIKTNADNLYDISGYSKMVVSFYVVDTTKDGYSFDINLVKGDKTLYKTISGVYSTGWHVEEFEFTSDTPDFVNGARIVFNGNNEADTFNFYLESISFETASHEIEGLEFVNNPAARKKCEDSGSHTWATDDMDKVIETVVPATCDKNGYSYTVCTECGYMELTLIEAIGHKFEPKVVENNQVIVKGDCESNSYAIHECTVENCGATTKVLIPNGGHKFEKLENQNASDGYKAPTCDETGYDVYVCVNEDCNHSDKKFLLKTPEIGHVKANGATETEIQALSCTDDRIVEVSECATCGESYQLVTDKATGHNYEPQKVDATCTENGRTFDKCSRCGDETNEEVIYATGHTAPAMYLQERVAATCTNAKGWKYACTTCGQDVYDADPGEVPLGHEWDENAWYTINEAECGNDGLRDNNCIRCGEDGRISEFGNAAQQAYCVIPATGDHVWYDADTLYDDDEWTESDDYVAGVRGERWHSCTNPNCSYTEEGDKPESAGTIGLVFTYNNNGAYVITGYTGDVDVTEIVVPASYKDKPVIVGNGFAGNTNITKITIAEGALISDGAFMGCTALESVTLPEGITALPVDIFNGCTALKSIELPATCTEIRTGAFYGCSALETVVINGSLTKVQMYAFVNCDNLTFVKYVNENVPYMVIDQMGNEKLLGAKWSAIEAE